MNRVKSIRHHLLGGALAVAAATAVAEEPASAVDPIASLVGERVRVSQKVRDRSSAPVTGTLAEIRDDILRITIPDSDEPRLIQRDTVTRLEVARGRQSMWRAGLTIGATAGGLVGLIPAGICAGNYPACADEGLTGVLFSPLVLGAMGGALGAVIGGTVRGDRWEDATPGKVTVRVTRVRTGVGFTVAIALPPSQGSR